MAPPNNLLVPGAMPLIGRMFEASAAGSDAAEMAPPHAAPCATAPAAAPPPGTTAATHRLPFVDQIVAFQSGASITVSRRLTLDADLFLADHNFVYAPGVKPLAECFPVVPMTVSLEIMAETAACLVPGCGLVGIEGVSAHRWIAVADAGALALRIEGRRPPHGLQHERERVAVDIYASDEATASVSATLVFGTTYAVAPRVQWRPMPVSTTRDAARLYAERHLFHGPRFQALAGSIELGRSEISADFLVKPAHELFASLSEPQLLTDPALLDGVGQLMAIWAMQQAHAAFPIGLGKLELYGPTPPAGTLVQARVTIAPQQLNMLSADVEIGDGAGRVWMHITDWKSWQFTWPSQLVDFQRQPRHYLLTDRQVLPSAPADLVCQRLSTRRVAGFDLALLARHYLHPSEMAAFASKKKIPKRQLEWLLGRIAAKDAARSWSGAASGTTVLLHPAAFAIENAPSGRPQVTLWPSGPAAPFISLAHSGEHAVALAHGRPVGIDIEHIAVHDEHFLTRFTSVAERRLLAEFSGPERTAWITRLWCAKEALGKRLGTRIDSVPHCEAQSVAADHSLQMSHIASGTQARVVTMRDGDIIIAFDAASTN